MFVFKRQETSIYIFKLFLKLLSLTINGFIFGVKKYIIKNYLGLVG